MITGILPLFRPTAQSGFEFRVVIPEESKTFDLPLGTSGAYAHNFNVVWGDGSSSTITSYSDVERTHTYVSAGTYDILIDGTCEYFGFNDDGDENKVTALLRLDYDLGFKVFNCHGAINLISVDTSFINFSSLTTAELMFYNCNSLGAIPANLFDNCTTIQSFYGAFGNCDAITSIPIDLFKYNISATNFATTFYSCNALTSIPVDLFRYNTLVTSFANTFMNCAALTAIPTDVFRYNTLAGTLDFSNVFNSCTAITEIPIDLFRYNASAISFAGAFKNCTSLTSIPTDLVRYNLIVVNVSQMFSGCIGLVGNIYGNLFSYQDYIDSFLETFYGCIGLTGIDWETIISNAEGQVSPPSTTDGCFEGCTSLTTYELIPIEWR